MSERTEKPRRKHTGTVTESTRVGGQIEPRGGNECDHVPTQQRHVEPLQRMIMWPLRLKR